MIFSDVLNQGTVFAAGFFCGAVCGIYYDVIFALRVLSKAGGVLTAVLDFIFCLLSSVTFFYVMYFCNGLDLKWYVFAALISGFALERFSFKKPVAQITAKVYNILKKIKIRFKKLNLFKKTPKEGV